MRRTLFLTLALAALGAIQAGVASALTIGFDPATQTVTPGDSLTVDIVASNLGGGILSAYDLGIAYDSTVLTGTAVNFAGSLGNPLLFEVFQDSDLTTSGLVGMAEVSLLSDAALLALQGGDSVVLATLAFEVIGAGTSSLDFVLDAFTQAVGLNAITLQFEVESGSVEAIPEPSAAIVFAIGSLIMGSFISRKRFRETKR